MATRTVGSVKGLEDLNLPPDLKLMLEHLGVSARDIIALARENENVIAPRVIPKVGSGQTQRIFEAVDKAGFIFHESPRSRAFRNFFVEAGLCEEVGSEHEYESRKPFSERIVESTLTVLQEVLHEQEAKIIELMFGLESGKPMNQKQCRAQLGLSVESFARRRVLALYKVKAPVAHHQLWQAMNGQPVTDARSQRKLKSISQAPIVNLCLSEPVIKALIKRDYCTIGELCEAKREILKVTCKLTNLSLDEIEARLADHGVGLAK